MDDFNIYEDLELLHAQEKQKEVDQLQWKEKYEVALETIGKLQTDKKDLNKKIKQLEINFASLLDTARTEIKRKDVQIAQLRREKDDICFRRNGRSAKNNSVDRISGENDRSEAVYVNPFSLVPKNMAKKALTTTDDEKNTTTSSNVLLAGSQEVAASTKCGELRSSCSRERDRSRDMSRADREKLDKRTNCRESRSEKRRESDTSRHTSRDLRGRRDDRHMDYRRDRFEKNSLSQTRRSDSSREKHKKDQQRPSHRMEQKREERIKKPTNGRHQRSPSQQDLQSKDNTHSIKEEPKSAKPIDLKTKNGKSAGVEKTTPADTPNIEKKTAALKKEILNDVKELKKIKQSEQIATPTNAEEETLKVAKEKSNKFIDALFDDMLINGAEEQRNNLYDDLPKSIVIFDKTAPKKSTKVDENSNVERTPLKRSVTNLINDLFGPSPAGRAISTSEVGRRTSLSSVGESSNDTVEFLPTVSEGKKKEDLPLKDCVGDLKPTSSKETDPTDFGPTVSKCKKKEDLPLKDCVGDLKSTLSKETDPKKPFKFAELDSSFYSSEEEDAKAEITESQSDIDSPPFEKCQKLGKDQQSNKLKFIAEKESTAKGASGRNEEKTATAVITNNLPTHKRKADEGKRDDSGKSSNLSEIDVPEKSQHSSTKNSEKTESTSNVAINHRSPSKHSKHSSTSGSREHSHRSERHRHEGKKHHHTKSSHSNRKRSSHSSRKHSKGSHSRSRHEVKDEDKDKADSDAPMQLNLKKVNVVLSEDNKERIPSSLNNPVDDSFDLKLQNDQFISLQCDDISDEDGVIADPQKDHSFPKTLEDLVISLHFDDEVELIEEEQPASVTKILVNKSENESSTAVQIGDSEVGNSGTDMEVVTDIALISVAEPFKTLNVEDNQEEGMDLAKEASATATSGQLNDKISKMHETRSENESSAAEVFNNFGSETEVVTDIVMSSVAKPLKTLIVEDDNCKPAKSPSKDPQAMIEISPINAPFLNNTEELSVKCVEESTNEEKIELSESQKSASKSTTVELKEDVRSVVKNLITDVQEPSALSLPASLQELTSSQEFAEVSSSIGRRKKIKTPRKCLDVGTELKHPCRDNVKIVSRSEDAGKPAEILNVHTQRTNPEEAKQNIYEEHSSSNDTLTARLFVEDAEPPEMPSLLVDEESSEAPTPTLEDSIRLKKNGLKLEADRKLPEAQKVVGEESVKIVTIVQEDQVIPDNKLKEGSKPEEVQLDVNLTISKHNTFDKESLVTTSEETLVVDSQYSPIATSVADDCSGEIENKQENTVSKINSNIEDSLLTPESIVTSTNRNCKSTREPPFELSENSKVIPDVRQTTKEPNDLNGSPPTESTLANISDDDDNKLQNGKTDDAENPIQENIQESNSLSALTESVKKNKPVVQNLDACSKRRKRKVKAVPNFINRVAKTNKVVSFNEQQFDKVESSNTEGTPKEEQGAATEIENKVTGNPAEKQSPLSNYPCGNLNNPEALSTEERQAVAVDANLQNGVGESAQPVQLLIVAPSDAEPNIKALVSTTESFREKNGMTKPAATTLQPVKTENYKKNMLNNLTNSNAPHDECEKDSIKTQFCNEAAPLVKKRKYGKKLEDIPKHQEQPIVHSSAVQSPSTSKKKAKKNLDNLPDSNPTSSAEDFTKSQGQYQFVAAAVTIDQQNVSVTTSTVSETEMNNELEKNILRDHIGSEHIQYPTEKPESTDLDKSQNQKSEFVPVKYVESDSLQNSCEKEVSTVPVKEFASPVVENAISSPTITQAQSFLTKSTNENLSDDEKDCSAIFIKRKMKSSKHPKKRRKLSNSSSSDTLTGDTPKIQPTNDCDKASTPTASGKRKRSLTPTHHKIFHEDVSSENQTVPPIYNANGEDVKYQEIDNRMRSIFQSPTYPHINGSSSFELQVDISNAEVTIDETLNQSQKSQCDTSSSSRKVSVGSNDYVIEVIGAHTANVFVTRKKCKKRPKVVKVAVATA